MLLTETLPEFAQELQRLLQVQKPELAAQVPILKIVRGCGCGDDFCASFYTQPKPEGAYGPGHDTLLLDTEAPGMLMLDVVDGIVESIEAGFGVAFLAGEFVSEKHMLGSAVVHGHWPDR